MLSESLCTIICAIVALQPQMTHALPVPNVDNANHTRLSLILMLSKSANKVDQAYGIGGANLFNRETADSESDDDGDNSSNVNLTDGVMDKKVKLPGYTVAEIENVGNWMHTINLKIGSSNQSVKVALDTGSTDLWVANNSLCSDNLESECQTFGAFDPENSTSFVNKNKQFNDSYGDSFVQNTWAQDNFYIGNLYLKNLWFGVSYSVSTALRTGILGLNFYKDEKTVVSKFQKASGAKKQGFGIYLGEPGDGNKGSIVFGGIDYAKVGEDGLHPIPVISGDTMKPGNNIASWSFALRETKIGGDTLSNTNSNALFDTGTTAIMLSNESFYNLAKNVEAVEDQNSNWNFKCPKTYDDLEFKFDNVTIKVPTKQLYTVNGENCTFYAVQNQGDSLTLLGAYFLRYAYVYFDVNKKAALVGQANFTDKTNITTMTEDVTWDTSLYQ